LQFLPHSKIIKLLWRKKLTTYFYTCIFIYSTATISLGNSNVNVEPDPIVDLTFSDPPNPIAIY
jgi:hypothetical protein